MAVSDDELYDASREMQDAVYAMVEVTGMDHGAGADFATARLRQVNTIASLSLEKIQDEFDRMTEVALNLNHNDRASEEFSATKKLLTSWRGDAALEFDGKIDNLAQYLLFIGQVSWLITHCVGGFYALAKHSRDSLSVFAVRPPQPHYR